MIEGRIEIHQLDFFFNLLTNQPSNEMMQIELIIILMKLNDACAGSKSTNRMVPQLE